MKITRKGTALALILALLLTALPCAFSEEAESSVRLCLGTSGYAVTIDDDFVLGELTQEEIESGRIGCYECDDTGLELDVSQISKEGVSESLHHYVLDEADKYELVEVVRPRDVINGIDVAWYRTREVWEGVDYDTATYIIDSGDSYVELEFWMADDDDAEEAQRIIDSLRPLELKQIQLGTSDFFLTVPADFKQGEMTEEDIADDQKAYWYSDESLLDFDVYQFSKEGLPETLAEYVVQEAADYQGVSQLTTDGEISGIPAAWYRAVEEYDEGEYDTITFIFDRGDEYIEVVFWLDGLTASAQADSIIRSVTRAAQESNGVPDSVA